MSNGRSEKVLGSIAYGTRAFRVTWHGRRPWRLAANPWRLFLPFTGGFFGTTIWFCILLCALFALLIGSVLRILLIFVAGALLFFLFWTFDLDLRPIRHRIPAGRNHRVSLCNSANDLSRILIADPDLHLFLMRLTVAARHQHVVARLFAMKNGCDWHHNRVFCSFRRHRNRHGQARA